MKISLSKFLILSKRILYFSILISLLLAKSGDAQSIDNSKEAMSNQVDSIFELTKYGLQLIDHDEYAKAKLHLLKASHLSSQFIDSNLELQRSANLLASYCIDFNYVSNGIEPYPTLLSDSEKYPDTTKSPLYRFSVSLDMCLSTRNECTTAAKLFQVLSEKQLTPAENVRVLTNLGAVRFVEGNLVEARRLFLQAITKSSDKQVRGLSFTWIGLLAEREGKWHESAASYREALSNYEGYYGADHIFVAGKLRDLGRILTYLGEGYEAESVLARAHGIFNHKFGRTHPKTLELLAYLANAQQGNHNYRAAVLNNMSLLDAELNFPSRNLEDALVSFQNMALSLFHSGRREDALKLFMASREAMKHCGCGKFENRVQVDLNLMNLLLDLDRTSEAEAIALEVRQRVLREKGGQDPFLISALNGIALSRMHANDYFAALNAIEEAVHIAQTQVGGNYAHLLPVLHNLSVALEHTGNLAEARATASEVVAVHDEGLIQDTVVTAMMLEHAAKLQMQIDDSGQGAASLFQRLARAYQKILEPRSDRRFSCESVEDGLRDKYFSSHVKSKNGSSEPTVLSAGFSGADLPSIDYDPWDRWTVLARVLNSSAEQMSRKNLHEAIKILKSGLQQFPEQPEILKRLADIYNMDLPDSEKDLTQAQKLYEAAILSGAAEHDPAIYYSRATASLRQQNWADWMTNTTYYYQKAYYQVSEADRLMRARGAICKFRGHSEVAKKLKIDCSDLESGEK